MTDETLDEKQTETIIDAIHKIDTARESNAKECGHRLKILPNDSMVRFVEPVSEAQVLKEAISRCNLIIDLIMKKYGDNHDVEFTIGKTYASGYKRTS